MASTPPFLIAAMRAWPSAGAWAKAYSSISFQSACCWPGVSVLYLTPSSARRSILCAFVVSRSLGASALTMAALRCASSSDCSSVRARSSSAARTRVPVFGPVRTSAGLLPKNCGLERDRRSAHDRPVLRDVVPLEAPAPRLGGGRRAEDGEQVAIGEAVRLAVPVGLLAGVAFGLVEHRLERADALDLGEAPGAEAGLEQLHRGGALRVGHREVGESLARDRRVEPVLALVVGEGEGRGGLLPGVERRQEGRGGVAHLLGGRGLAGAAGRREREDEADGQGGEHGTRGRPGNTLLQCGHEGVTLLRTVVDSPLYGCRAAGVSQLSFPPPHEVAD